MNQSKPFKALIKLLEDGNYGYRTNDAFNAMLTHGLMQINPNANSLLPIDSSVPKELPEQAWNLYLEIVKQCSPFEDIFSQVFMSCELGNKHSGQFFTPFCISVMMATMNLSPLPEPKEDCSLHSMIDPCVGAGGMVLAAMKVIHQQDPDALLRFAFSGVDIDLRCISMTVTQIIANMQIHELDVGAVSIFHGNALGNMKDLKAFFSYQSDNIKEEEYQLPTAMDVVAYLEKMAA